MKHIYSIRGVVLLLAAFSSAALAETVPFRFQFGLAYVNGVSEISDELEKKLGATTNFVWPVGLVIRPEWGIGKNLSFSLSAGPMTVITIERRYVGLGGYSDKDFNVNLPVGADLRYSMGGSGTVVPYIRGGVRHNIVVGDAFESGSAGVAGGLGLHFRSQRGGFGWMIEAGSDSSTTKIATTKVKPSGFMLTVLTAF